MASKNKNKYALTHFTSQVKKPLQSSMGWAVIASKPAHKEFLMLAKNHIQKKKWVQLLQKSIENANLHHSGKYI